MLVIVVAVEVLSLLAACRQVKHVPTALLVQHVPPLLSGVLQSPSLLLVVLQTQRACQRPFDGFCLLSG